MKEKCEKIWDIPYELMSGREQNKRVYSTNGLCPTLYCFGGGNTETKIMMKTICLNSKVNGKQPSLNDRVYSRGGYQWLLPPRDSSWETYWKEKT